ncbi:N4-gp56 family major capsid protein [Bacillus infantis]|uniref:N4-gp56 family major capsid protein n=1 Tax=Bacillus infantis TaxID=324767 RepID=A0A5D4RB37_9BACI|nr:N4-gp56 family major capsid protein [Bacillus infantis]TYS46762.1 N4-gp56 family major capsid protein [Bacillus infantis]
MAVNLASKYSSKVDERFKNKSFTEIAVNRDYEWTGVRSISVFSVPTVAMGNYTMTGANRYGTPAELDNTKQDMIVTRDRAFTFTIDRRNHLDTQMTQEAGKALARQQDEVITPEIDIYRLGVMSAAAVAAGGVSAATAITASNAYAQFLKGTEYLDNNSVPTGGRIAFVTPAFYNFIKLDPTFVKQSDTSQKIVASGLVGEIDGLKIIKVPANYLPANTPFLLTHKVATVAADKLEDYKTHDNPPGINGWLVEGRTVYDAFVLEQKKKALYVHKTA